MKKQSIQVNNMPDTLKKLRDLKPVLKRKLEVAVEAAEKHTSYKSVESLRNELMKDYTKKQARYFEILRAVEQMKYDLDKSFGVNVIDLYDGADIELSKISEKLRNIAIAQKTEALKRYFNEYAITQSADFLEFEKSCIKVTLEENMKSLQKKARGYIDSMATAMKQAKSGETKFTVTGEFVEAAVGMMSRVRTLLGKLKK